MSDIWEPVWDVYLKRHDIAERVSFRPKTRQRFSEKDHRHFISSASEALCPRVSLPSFHLSSGSWRCALTYCESVTDSLWWSVLKVYFRSVTVALCPGGLGVTEKSLVLCNLQMIKSIFPPAAVTLYHWAGVASHAWIFPPYCCDYVCVWVGGENSSPIFFSI